MDLNNIKKQNNINKVIIVILFIIYVNFVIMILQVNLLVYFLVNHNCK